MDRMVRNIIVFAINTIGVVGFYGWFTSTSMALIGINSETHSTAVRKFAKVPKQDLSKILMFNRDSSSTGTLTAAQKVPASRKQKAFFSFFCRCLRFC